MPDYGSIGPVALLAAGTVIPLVCTLAPAEPKALAAGIILAGVLVRLTTFDPPGPTPKAFDKGLEAAAISNVVLTSNGNRLTRLLLGSVYLYAAGTFVLRMVRTEAGGPPPGWSAMAVAWLGSFVDLYIAGLWLSSGADGQ